MFSKISFFPHCIPAPQILMNFSDIGRKPPVFCEAVFLAQEVLDSGFEFDMGEMYYNTFRYKLLLNVFASFIQLWMLANL